MTAASPSNRKIPRYLVQIIENADRISAHIEGLDEKAFADDVKTQDAVERCLLRLTEGIIRIKKKDAALLSSDIDWKDLGDRLRHEYDNIEVEQIWATIQSDLGPLKQQCAQALEALKAQDPGAS